ncbi:hypothetical protein [Streptomyces melanogenes]|uniref:Uncharacterized protein n=1 Tax=Streptomyces melanogenes TaxID=67326 RepID=A0ABZ1XVY2_9ACTN|nr:hypothetical protein [Streptomyces melanogenes]
MLRTSVARAAAVTALLVSALGVAAASSGTLASTETHAAPIVVTPQTMGWS